MITKVTSANYDAYTLLFNQADTALKESRGEPTSEFLEVAVDAAYDPNIQYFDENYSPVTFEVPGGSYADAEAAFEDRDTDKKWYVLNEKVIYDLDTYFGRLRLLSDIDYSFLRLPLDEPTFDIVDDAQKGRRVIQVPDDFAKNGISVQGDETAEILFFSIDRYYDSTDLWAEGMNYIIQWKTATKNGVTRAFLNKDSRPFIDDDGKLYFGWPVSSEITDEAGNVMFSVRIFKFSDNVDADGKPILAFGLNTQPATVKVNASLAFEFKNTTEFEDAKVISKNNTVISRIINSTVINKGTAEAASVPVFVQNLLSAADLATAIQVHTMEYEVYKIASGIFDDEETYYNIMHEPVELNENTYVANVYYTKETETQEFYEFEAEDIIDKLQQVQATVESGVITYTSHSQTSPTNSEVGGNYQFIGGDSIVYAKVTSETRELNHKYYAFDVDTNRFIVALDIVTNPGEEWVAADRKNGVEDGECLYYERFSPQMVINPETPVGCYWIVANNNDGKKAMSTADSYKIWIPGPVDLEAENLDDDEFEKILISGDKKARMDVTLTGVAANNTVNYVWFKDSGEGFEAQDLESASAQAIDYTEANLGLVDDTYKVECHTVRNKQHSNAIISKEFRVTDEAHNFVFDDVAPDEAHMADGRKVIIRDYENEDSYNFTIDFSENLDDDNNLTIVSDKVLYRFKGRSARDDQPNNVFWNDPAAAGAEDGLNFIETTFDALKEKVFTIPENAGGEDTGNFYVEVINIVNEDFDLDELNTLANALYSNPTIGNQQEWQKYEPRIARTPYMKVRY